MRLPARFLVYAAVTTASASAWADGGYYAGTKGARAAGRAGAFTVKADDIMAAQYNPAGFSRVEGTLVQIGNRFSYNAHSFERQSTLDWGNTSDGVPPYVQFQRVENDKPWQLLDPLLGVASNLGFEGWGFGLSVYAPPGVSREEFPALGPQRYMMVRREAQLIDYAGSVAWRMDDLFGVGASLQWIYLRKLDYQLVIDGAVFRREANPVSSELDMLSSLSGSDPFIPNLVLGAWYRPLPYLELGVSGQVIPTSMKTESTLSVEPQSPGVTDVSLRRGSSEANDVSLELPLPLTARVGARYLHRQGDRELFDVELDVVYETWSRVERFTMDGQGLVAEWRGQTVDIGNIEIEKQWQDTVGVHLGGDFAAIPGLLTARAGLFYETAVADPAYMHVDFASGRQLGGALGASVLFDRFEAALGYEFRYQPTVTVNEGDAKVYQEVPASACEPPYTDTDTCNAEYLGQPAPAVNAGSYRAYSHMASLDLLYRF